MLAEGKVTADEAERLLGAIEREQPPPAAAVTGRPQPRPRYLRVAVSWPEVPGSYGAGRINIRIPLQLLRAGVRLASLLPPQALARVNAELARAGMPIDLTELKPQHIGELIDQLAEVSVDVDDPGSQVKVFCE